MNSNPAIFRTLVAAALFGAAGVQAQSPRAAPARTVPVRTGQQVFETVCQACHLPGGVGDPATYPPLAGNPRLEDGRYPAYVVLNGLKAMPAFAAMLQDQEVANVVNYVRANFGNNYQKPITEQEVRDLR